MKAETFTLVMETKHDNDALYQLFQYFWPKLSIYWIANVTKVTSNMVYKKRLLLRYIHHFKSDLINNMDHMFDSGNEPYLTKRSDAR